MFDIEEEDIPAIAYIKAHVDLFVPYRGKSDAHREAWQDSFERQRDAWQALLENGTLYTHENLDVSGSHALQKEYHCKIKECYYNAQKIALFDPSYTYVEGIAESLIPMSHAWLVKDGKVYDPTWRVWEERDVVYSGNYFGAAIPREFISEKWSRDRLATPMIFEYLIRKDRDG